jgi:large repetitive protein
MINNKYKIWIWLIAVLCLWTSGAMAQSATYGNTFVFGGAEKAVHAVNHSFNNGSLGTQPGIVATERTFPQGYLSFVGATASWSSATDAQHVDGYVKTYLTTAFTFPIGDNGIYRPAKISAASFAQPSNAAYFGVNPTTAITSSMKGGFEPVLPTSTYPSATVAANGKNVSTSEYWDINGTVSAQISLTWNAASGVAAMTGSTLSRLTIVGWNTGTAQWEVIGSTVDATSILGGASSLTSGSITTNASVVPNTYEVYTLAAVCNVTPPVSQMGSPNPICFGSSTSLLASCSADTLKWYSNAGLTTLVGVGTGLSVSPTATTTYYASCVSGICQSTAVTATITVNPIPAISSYDSVNPSGCLATNGSFTLKGLLPNVSYTLTYVNPIGSSISATVNTDGSGNALVSLLTGGNYTNIKVSRFSCVSNTIASIKLTPPAPAPTAPNTTPICLGTSSVLASATTGGTVTWFGDKAMSSVLGTGTPFTVTPLVTTKYYLAIVNSTNGCKSAVDSVTVVVANNCPNFPIPDTTIHNPNPGTPFTVGPVTNPPTGGSVSAAILGGFKYKAADAQSINTSTGVITFTPNDTAFVGQDTIIRQVCFTLGGLTKCDTSLVIVDNKAPNKIFKDTTFLNTPKALAKLPVLIFEGGTPTTTTSSPKLTVSVAGIPTYTPTPGFVGIDTVNVYRCDGASPQNCDTTKYIVTVLPKIADSVKATTVNTPVSVGPAVTPSPNVSQQLTASNGTPTLNPDGTVKYTPNPNFVGTDTVKRIVCTTIPPYCDTALIIINVAPKYPDSTLKIAQGTPTTVGPTVSIMPGSTLLITKKGPSNGTATINPNGTITYTPSPTFIGRDTVVKIVKVTFANGTSITDTSLDIFIIKPNMPDIIDSTRMNIGKITGTPVIAGPGTSADTKASALRGTTTVNPDGTINYQPNLGFVGVDTITKIVCMLDSATMTSSCDTSLIIMKVFPYVKDDLVTTPVNTPINTGGPVTAGPGSKVTQVLTAKNGTPTLNPDGSVNYSPNKNYVGTDTITRVICDSNYLGKTCHTSLIIVNVTPQYPDTNLVSLLGLPVTGGTPVYVMAGSTPNITTSGPTNGTIVVNPDGTITYKPNPGFVGKDTVVRKVCITFADASTVCDTSLIIVTSIPHDTTVTVGTPMNVLVVVGTPVNPGPGVTIDTKGSSKNGTTTVNPDNTITYVPNTNFVGTDTVRRIICVTISGVTTCDTSYTIVNVSPNYPDTTVTTPQGTSVTAGIPVKVMPGSTSSVKTSGPSNGKIVVNSDGTVTYSPKPGFVGKDTVVRIVCITFANGTSKCDTSLIVIIVTPKLADTTATTSSGSPVNIGPAVVSTSGAIVSQNVTAGHGTTTVNPDGTITYTPDSTFSGLDTIRRIVCVLYLPSGIEICDTSYIIVAVKGGNELVPNYISPNGDNNNDVWDLDQLLKKYPNTRASIYNRWGNIVWRSTGTYGYASSMKNVWYGQLEGSIETVPDGVYYYLLELEDEFRTTKTGFIEVMRK